MKHILLPHNWVIHLKNKQLKEFSKKKVIVKKKQQAAEEPGTGDGLIRLNKYIANSGVCSRREADKIIADGLIAVNGTVITELGHKVSTNDEVTYQEIGRAHV